MMYSIIFFNHLSKIYNFIKWILIVLVLSFSDGNVENEHMDLSTLKAPIKTNNKIPGMFKHELGSRIIEEFIVLSPKTYSFKDYPKNTKEKVIKKCNNAKHEEYYNALMYNKERVVQECRIQKVGDNMTTTKTSKISLNTFDDKKFYVNNIKSYSHDENLYLFKRDQVNRVCKASLDQMMDLELDNKDNKDNKYNKDLLINNIPELTTNDDRKLIEAAIRLNNAL